MPKSVTAIFDIGKTNKKFFLFDESFAIEEEISEHLPETQDEGGFPCEDISLLNQWMRDTAAAAFSNPRYRITGLNFSTYGASMVHLDHGDEIVGKLYNYLKPLPEDLQAQFYETYGGEEKISLETASPALGMLNSGLQLYWLKHRKRDLFKHIHRALHLPQYCSYLFTGVALSEMTSIGCHTCLWDFRQERYHSWVFEEELNSLLPPVARASTRLQVPIGRQMVSVGVGIHDSSAALVPYLLRFGQSFLLLSTGTWSIALNPFAEHPLTAAELRHDCLAYLNYKGNPVKAARLFLGHEHKQQVQRLASHFGKDVHAYQKVRLDPDLLQRLRAKQNPRRRFVPDSMKGSGPISEASDHQWPLEAFSSFEEAYHQLMMGLVELQVQSMELILDGKPVRKLFVDGGFARNELFTRLLADALPETEVYSAQLPQASALGAAMVIRPELTWGMEDEPANITFVKVSGI